MKLTAKLFQVCDIQGETLGCYTASDIWHACRQLADDLGVEGFNAEDLMFVLY